MNWSRSLITCATATVELPKRFRSARLHTMQIFYVKEGVVILQNMPTPVILQDTCLIGTTCLGLAGYIPSTFLNSCLVTRLPLSVL